MPLAVSNLTTAAFQLGPMAAIGLLYATRAHALSVTRSRVPGWRQGCFYGGFAIIALALIGLGGKAHELLYVSMIEHLLLGDIGALFIVLGLTGPIIEPLLRIRFFDRLRLLAHPAVAFPLWALDLCLWHLPVFYQSALRHSSIQVVQHVMFITAGVNMWMCLFGPLPMPQWLGNLGRLLYILAVRLTGAVLGNIFLWSGTVFYPFYLHGDAINNISPLADQNIAGAIMMVEASILMLALLYWLFLRSTRESEERQNLLDYAQANGIELSEARVARAVSAGMGTELRRRLETARTGSVEPG